MPSLQLLDAPYAQLDNRQSSVINNFVKVDSDESRAIAFHKVGTGKTRLAYGWLLLLRQLERGNRCLIIIKPKGEYDWRSEAELIGFNLWRCKFVSFANLKTVNPSINYDTVIIDELHLFSNSNSQRSRRLAYITGKASNVLGLTGTLFSTDDNTCIWGYCVAVGISSYIARGITHFRSQYQTSFSAKWNEQLTLFQPKAGWRDQLFPKLGKRFSSYHPRNYVRSTDREIRVALTSEQTRLINKLVKLYVLETPDGEILFKRATHVYHTVRKITNGWFHSAKGQVCMVGSEKRAVLLEKLSELHDASEQHIVWCAYRDDIKVIRGLLQVPSLLLVGGQSFDIAAWNAGTANLVLATIDSSSSVNFLNSVKWGLFFSLAPGGRLAWEQARGRMGRRGADVSSPNQFLRYTAISSVDEKIYSSIRKTEVSEEQLIADFQREHNIKLPI